MYGAKIINIRLLLVAYVPEICSAEVFSVPELNTVDGLG